MATLKFDGLKQYEAKLQRLSADIDGICGRATYRGAKIVADEVKREIEALPIVHGYGTSENKLPGGVTETQKQGLIEGFGISGLRDDGGYHNVKLGFDGYNTVRTKSYPNGQPNQLVARGTESGTTWKEKHPFVRTAVNRSQKPATAEMERSIQQDIDEIMK